MEQSYRQLIEYAKIHLISLEQDSAKVVAEMAQIEDMDSDEYKFKEIEDISNNGKILATQQIMSLASAILLGLEKEGM